MAQSILPFPFKPEELTPRDKLLAMVSPELRKACEQSTFLTGYLQHVPLDEIGVPALYAKPTRSMSQLPVRNLIYPIKEGLIVHIYPDANGGRDNYISIEPTVVVPIDHLMP